MTRRRPVFLGASFQRSLGRGAERRVSALAVVEDLEEVKERRAGLGMRGEEERLSSSHSSVAKKLSAMALS